jgi:hypothetical protein
VAVVRTDVSEERMASIRPAKKDKILLSNVFHLLVRVNIVPKSLILVNLMTDMISPSETLLTGAT